MSFDFWFLGVLPYVAIALFLVVSIRRYLRNPFTFSSLSSQFLETRRLFWGSVPFHLGILLLFFGHLVGFLFPREVTLWNRHPVRLLILEGTALRTRRTMSATIPKVQRSARLRRNTSGWDVVVYLLLMFQIVTGLWVALGYRWGSAWYTQTAVPYIRSIFLLAPNLDLVAGLPLVVKLHIIGAWVLFAVFSFTRLVHILVAPVPYLWRPVQLVIWNRARSARGRA